MKEYTVVPEGVYKVLDRASGKILATKNTIREALHFVHAECDEKTGLSIFRENSEGERTMLYCYY